MSLLIEEFETLIGSRCSGLNPVFSRQLFLNHPLISLFAASNFRVLCCFCTFITLLLSIRSFCTRNSNPMEQRIRISKERVGSALTLCESLGSALLFSKIDLHLVHRLRIDLCQNALLNKRFTNFFLRSKLRLIFQIKDSFYERPRWWLIFSLPAKKS